MNDSSDTNIYNCHVHVFTIHQVPNEAHPAIPLLRSRGFVRTARAVLAWMNPLINAYLGIGSPSRIGLPLRLLAFLDIGESDSKGNPVTQQLIFDRLWGAYPSGTKFVLLPIDMDYITHEYRPAPRNYELQLQELRDLRTKMPDVVMPFICADPRRPKFLDLIKEYIEQHQFAGIKLYPALGFFPFDARLDDMYSWAEANEVPITTHCTPGGLYARRFEPTHRVHPKTHRHLPGNSPSEFAKNYSDPRNYDWVLERFPKLKLCFAHLGGDWHWRRFLEQSRETKPEDLSWTSVILNHMKRFPNVYADISYAAYDRDLLPLLKVFVNTPYAGERILFGTDYFVVRVEAAEREFSIRVRGFLGEADYFKIANTNPKKFLQNRVFELI
ncbi:MAG: amidohydrolase family protein [Meiothermus sp.]|nr:amidohydrolase family protein [Meiothermus sp.]